MRFPLPPPPLCIYVLVSSLSLRVFCSYNIFFFYISLLLFLSVHEKLQSGCILVNTFPLFMPVSAFRLNCVCFYKRKPDLEASFKFKVLIFFKLRPRQLHVTNGGSERRLHHPPRACLTQSPLTKVIQFDKKKLNY